MDSHSHHYANQTSRWRFWRPITALCTALASIAAILGMGVSSSALLHSTLDWTGLTADTAQAADEYPDIMLGVFTNSAYDTTDSIYVSMDGVHMEKISEAFTNLYPTVENDNRAVGSMADGRSWNLYSFTCPSIIYYDGYFWMLANESNSGDDHTLRLVMTNSKDLVHWSDQKQVKINVPANVQSNGSGTQFDAVAADWAVMPNGKIAVAVSLGRYGDFHGQPEKDTMYPYLVIIDSIKATNDPSVNAKINNYTVNAQTATKIELPVSSSNRIDGSWYFENGKAYLSIKRDGVTNEIYSTDAALSKVGTKSAWTAVNKNVLTGYEAPSMTKLNGRYYFYTDELGNWTPDSHVRSPYYRTGTNVQIGTSMTSFSGAQIVQATTSSGKSMTVSKKNNIKGDGPRHGTVTTITDPAAKKIIWERRAAAGWKTEMYPFWDVTSTTPHAADISWLADLGITTGYANGSFGVGKSVVRQDMAAFLRRLAVSLNIGDAATWKPSASDWKVFADVTKASDAGGHAEDVLWLAHAGVAKGYTKNGVTTFEGTTPVYRQDMAAFLRRLAKYGGISDSGSWSPSASDWKKFADVAKASDAGGHAEDVLWLAHAGVTTGYTKNGVTTFEGMTTTYRQDMAAFLHRLYNLA